MAYGALQDALASRMEGKKKRHPPPAGDDGDGGDEGVTVEVDEPDDKGADMSSYEDVEDSAASDAFAAFKSGDEEAFKGALRDFVEACVKRQTQGK